MSVVKSKDGKWFVHWYDKAIGPFASNSEAWRTLDRLTGQTVSKSEETSEWLWDQRCEQ